MLAADIAGYSRLMEADEVSTLQRLTEYQSVIGSLIASHSGRIFGTSGDGLIAEFSSVVEAVRCAINVQDAIEERNKDCPWNERMMYRIGIHFGDVIVRGQNLFGAAVNVTSRLEGLADPGSICVSSAVRDDVWNKIPTLYVDLGEHHLKNIKEPVRAYRLLGNIKDQTPPTTIPNISSAKSSGPVVLVRHTVSDVEVGHTVRGKINVVFKNNGSRTAVLQTIKVDLLKAVTTIDCPQRGFSLFFAEWDYDINIDNDKELLGHHYLKPNEVETFDLIFGRDQGGPQLSVYRLDLFFYFDEQANHIEIKDLLIRIAGPGRIRGYRTGGMSEEEWCRCMWKNIVNFDEIGYDYRQHIRP